MADVLKSMLVSQVSKELKNGLVDEYIAKARKDFCQQNNCKDVDFIISQEADGRMYLSYVGINGSTICNIYKQMLLSDFLCEIIK